MAQNPTTYVSPPITNIAREIRALRDLAVLYNHCADALENGMGDYVGIIPTSAVFDLTGSNLLTLNVTNPFAPRQQGRFALTVVP